VSEHRLEREQWIAASPERVFAFFADAANLEAITPPWLGFRILSPLPVRMERDARIDYALRLGPLPVRWRTRIARWDPPHAFEDVQERGPYALWEHTHEFRPMAGGVLMSDRVRYRLPLGALGRLVHALAVRSLLAAIFDFRSRRIREIFGEPGAVERIESGSAAADPRVPIDRPWTLGESR
jgi:ligand-binding SRPBCC domain-containing protein